jgi:hypothetical protein
MMVGEEECLAAKKHKKHKKELLQKERVASCKDGPSPPTKVREPNLSSSFLCLLCFLWLILLARISQ